MAKVLISDKLDPLAVEIFEKNGIEVDFKPGLSPEEQLAIIDRSTAPASEYHRC